MRTPPWTMLQVQHRMHPDIRKLVSEATYMGALTDSVGMDIKGDENLHGIIPMFGNKRIIVMDHKVFETKVLQITFYGCNK